MKYFILVVVFVCSVTDLLAQDFFIPEGAFSSVRGTVRPPLKSSANIEHHSKQSDNLVNGQLKVEENKNGELVTYTSYNETSRVYIDRPVYVGADNEQLICSGITNITCKNPLGQPYTGLVYLYQFGALSQEFNLKNGKMDGEFKSYYRSDGTVREIGHYEDGKLIDSKTYYDYENGILWIEHIYNSTGDRFYKYYYRNGQIELEGKTKYGGKADGVRKRYYENGQLEVEENYKNGELVAFKAYDENGQPMSKKDYEEREIQKLLKASEGIMIGPE